MRPVPAEAMGAQRCGYLMAGHPPTTCGDDGLVRLNIVQRLRLLKEVVTSTVYRIDRETKKRKRDDDE